MIVAGSVPDVTMPVCGGGDPAAVMTRGVSARVPMPGVLPLIAMVVVDTTVFFVVRSVPVPAAAAGGATMLAPAADANVIG